MRHAGGRAPLALLAAGLVVLAETLAPGCADRPDPLARRNPFDPGNPETGGDPFRLRARATGVSVDLDWEAVTVPPPPANGPGMAPACEPAYSVYRAPSLDALAASPETLAAGLDTTGFRDASPVADGTAYYVVTLRTRGCVESLRSAALAVRVDLAPLVEIRAAACDTCPATHTGIRDVRVLVRAQDADSVLLANALAGDDLADPARLPATDAPIPWILPASASPADTVKVVFARVRRADGTLSPVVSDTILVERLTLHLLVNGAAEGPVATGRRTVRLTLRRSAQDPRPPASAESLEVSLAAPFPGAWQPFADSLEIALPSPDPDTVHVRVKNDFEIEAADSVLVRPDSLRGARIVLSGSLVLEPTEPASIGRCRVNVHVTGGEATEICLSNAAIPPCTGFEPIADVRADWPLEGPANRIARVYGILANEWRPEGAGVVADSIFLEGLPPSVRITFPDRLGDSTFTVGDSIAIAGTATRSTCGPDVRRVALFTGGASIGEATLRAAAPGDTVDLLWMLGWRVSGGPDVVVLAARLEDAADSAAADTVQVLVQNPPGGAP